MRSVIKQIIRSAWGSVAYAKALYAHDRAVTWRVTAEARAQEILFITPSGGGNIGDQAMFEAVLSNTTGPVNVVFSRPRALSIPDEFRPRVRVTVLPRLIRGQIILRAGAVRAFARALSSASIVLIPGADTIDGGHAHNSLTRLNLGHLAASRGIPVSVQGFSWSGEAPKSVTWSASKLAAKADLCPRDPVSAARLASSGIQPFLESADLVFSYKTTAALPDRLEASLRASDADGVRVLVLNISGLIARRIDLQSDYAALAEHAHGRGMRIVYLPHVLRDPDNDLVQARALYERTAQPGDFLVDHELRPAQVQALAARAHCAVTGRMHLAIMSLSQATPVVTLATVGKVEGLYEMVELPELVVQPRRGCANALITALDDVLSRREEMIEHIGASMPEIRERSMLNFRLLSNTET